MGRIFHQGSRAKSTDTQMVKAPSRQFLDALRSGDIERARQLVKDRPKEFLGTSSSTQPSATSAQIPTRADRETSMEKIFGTSNPLAVGGWIGMSMASRLPEDQQDHAYLELARNSSMSRGTARNIPYRIRSTAVLIALCDDEMFGEEVAEVALERLHDRCTVSETFDEAFGIARGMQSQPLPPILQAQPLPASTP